MLMRGSASTRGFVITVRAATLSSVTTVVLLFNDTLSPIGKYLTVTRCSSLSLFNAVSFLHTQSHGDAQNRNNLINYNESKIWNSDSRKGLK
jgi:hypothetical protein